MRAPSVPVTVLSLAGLALGAGCYASHGSDDAGDVGPTDARSIDAAALDAGAPGRPDTGSPDLIDGGPIIFHDVPPPGDAPLCLCASDADCPPPPPSWNCLAPLCSACTCSYRIVPELCGPGAVCDALGQCAVAPIDAGSPLDAFVGRRDAALPPRPDAFVVPVDAFVVPVDAFVVPLDAAVPPRVDAGRPPSSDALRFTASELMTVPHRPALSVGPELTFELWARLRSTGVIAIKGEPSIGSHLYLELRPSPDGSFRTFWLGWSSTGSRVVVEVDRPIAFDAWTHFAIVQRMRVDGRVEVELFVDGESASGPRDAGDVDGYIASFNAAPLVVGRTDMDVDEVRLWRVARGQAAIQGFMRTELAPGVSGLVAYWPLDGVGQVVLDRSLNGNDGYRGGSPAADRADPTWILDGAF